MPWKELDLVEQRFRFIEEWRSEDYSLAELCRHYEITRATGYKWVRRYEAGGLESLGDRSRAPHHHPNELPEEMEELVLSLRSGHPSWGAPKIRAKIRQDHAALSLPAESTIGAILQRNGLTLPRGKRRPRRASASPLVEPARSNHVWSADFKGWFHAGDGTRIDPLTITDNYSRYLFRCQSLNAADTLHSKPVFQAAFREFGLPERIRTDNGSPFGSNGESGLTGLSAWWIRLGIIPEKIQPGKPQQNGRHERMHRTLKQETASPPARNRRRQQERFDRFREEYNEHRPHQALGQKTPGSVYTASPRAYPERLREAEYPAGWAVRRISPGGQMRWKLHRVFISHAMEGDAIGLEPIDDGVWRVWYHAWLAGIFDEATLRLNRPTPEQITQKPSL